LSRYRSVNQVGSRFLLTKAASPTQREALPLSFKGFGEAMLVRGVSEVITTRGSRL
jgi:hypothetical protein